MKRVFLGIGVVAGVVVFGALPYFNPDRVAFRYAPDQVVQMPLGWLLLLAFAVGAGLVAGGFALREVGVSLAKWPARQRERKDRRVAELEEEGLRALWDGEVERARSLLSKAWRARPASGVAAMALAGAYVETGELDRARQALEEAVGRAPTDPDLRTALAEILRRLERHEEAIRILETVRVQHPRAPRVLAALRDLYQERGQWTNAVEVQRIYLEVVSRTPRASEERDRLLQLQYQAAAEIEDVDRRRQALEDVVRADGVFVPALVSLGDALVASDRQADALRLWERAFRRTPRVIFVERLLEHHASTRDRQRDLALLRKHCDQMQGSAGDSLRLLAARLFLQDDNAEAAAGELELLERRDSPQGRRLWAEVYRKRGDVTAAYEEAAAVADALGASLDGYYCIDCGMRFSAWTGYCARCRRWDTVRSNAEPLPAA